MKITKIQLIFYSILFFGFFGVTHGSQAATYYVDGVNGNNLNSGTSLTSAFKTIQTCLNKVVAGDSCLVRTGTYNEQLVLAATGQSRAPITLSNYSGEVVTISSGTGKALRANGRKNYYIINGLRFTATHTSFDQWGADYTVDFQDTLWDGEDPNGGSSFITVKNCYIEGAIRMYGHGNLVENCELNGKSVWGNAIYESHAVSHDNIYRGNKIYSYTARGVWTMENTTNTLVENNIIHDISYGYGIDCDGAYKAVYNCTLRGNTIYNLGGDALGAEDAFNAVFEKNIVYNSTTGVGCINYGINSDQTMQQAFQEYRNLDSNLIVRNNIFYNTDKNGLGSSACLGMHILNNVFYGNSASKGYFGAIAIGVYGGYPSDNAEIKNNIFAENKVTTFWLDKTAGGILPQGLQVSNNIYYNSVATTQVHMSNLADNSGSNYTFSQFKTATGYDFMPASMVSNPLFVSPTTGDFHLQSTSPAIDKGVALSSVTTDISGAVRPQGSAYDIGAYEYPQTSATICTSFTYSAWSACANGTQTRTVLTQSPAGCTGGNMILSQACAVYSNADFANLVLNWQKTIVSSSDVNKDGITDTRDLGIMMGSWQ